MVNLVRYSAPKHEAGSFFMFTLEEHGLYMFVMSMFFFFHSDDSKQGFVVFLNCPFWVQCFLILRERRKMSFYVL